MTAIVVVLRVVTAVLFAAGIAGLPVVRGVRQLLIQGTMQQRMAA